MKIFTVIPCGVEESRGATQGQFRGVPRLRGVYPERAKRVERASLGMTANRTLTILFSLVFGIASVAYGQSDADFTKATQEYAQGHFTEAITDYEALARAGQWSANLFYDLGNAYFRTGDFGRAILNYERALALERHHPEAAANLQIARDEARALELQQSWPERYLQFASVNQYSIAAAIAFWLAIFAVVSLIFTRRRSATAIAMLIFCLLISSVAIYAVYTLERGTNGSALAIVTGKEVQARLATADTANSVLALPPGSEVKILSTRGDWIYAALPNNLRGWIPAKSAEQVRL
ncbi:MAG TPA: tetratricopeptide repeat protein [Candidatus Udaeobacter sp.]|nr:tetratricopeptide repeat protein [Candidatus Udaeobacter sp.]